MTILLKSEDSFIVLIILLRINNGNSGLSCESYNTVFLKTEESSGNADEEPKKPSSIFATISFNFGTLNLNSPKTGSTIVPMGPGIYFIYCLSNGKGYIGQSVNASYRLGRHYEALLVNRADSRPLQEDWNKYGKENFKFIVLVSGSEYSDEQTRLKIEKKILSLNNENCLYNVLNPVSSGRKSRILWKGQPYPTIAAASRASGVSPTQVGRLADDPNVTDWERIPDNPNDNSNILNIESGIPISMDGQEFASVRNAEKVLNISRRTINRRLESDKFPNYYYLNRTGPADTSKPS